MFLSLFHLLFALIAVGFIFGAIVRYVERESHQTLPKFLSTFFVWSGVLFFALFPDMARVISGKLHIGENLNTLIFAGFVFTFLIIFRLLRSIERVESSLTTIVRAQTIENYKAQNAHRSAPDNES